ncbi:hypothetical protein [Streptomyces sp. NPDC058683]
MAEGAASYGDVYGGALKMPDGWPEPGVGGGGGVRRRVPDA